MTVPKISIVTPSYNQGQFLEETILSVLGQNYPNLEYIIMDGGSTDDSKAIIEKYADQLHYWVSEKDAGQSNAINKGFAKSTGHILMWLNSDDLLMPNVLQLVSDLYSKNDETLYFGNCIHFNNSNKILTSSGSNVCDEHENLILSEVDYIIQPSSFWSRKIWESVGLLREDLHFGFDWEWFLRVEKKYKLQPISNCLSMYRFHEDHKSGNGGKKRQEELLKIYKENNVAMSNLYENLMEENISAISSKDNSRIKLKNILGKKTSLEQKLKIFGNKEIDQYSSKQIKNAIRML